jgi:hypothetical protein
MVPRFGMLTNSCGANYVELLQLGLRVLPLEVGELEHRHALLLRRHFQRIGPRARLLGRAEHARHFVLAREKGLEHGLAEILLTDDGDLHAAFFGGSENAPAAFRLLIFESS